MACSSLQQLLWEPATAFVGAPQAYISLEGPENLLYLKYPRLAKMSVADHGKKKKNLFDYSLSLRLI